MVLPLPSTKAWPVFPGRFKTISPAAIECHMLMSLLEQSPVCMQVSADTASERQFLPEPERLNNSLLLADALHRYGLLCETKRGGRFLSGQGSKSLGKIIRHGAVTNRKCRSWRACHSRMLDGGTVGQRYWIWW